MGCNGHQCEAADCRRPAAVDYGAYAWRPGVAGEVRRLCAAHAYGRAATIRINHGQGYGQAAAKRA